MLIGLAAWKGLENIVEGANRWTGLALGLVAATLLVAAMQWRVHAGGMEFAITGRTLAVAAAMAAVAVHARRLEPEALRAWLWEA